MVQVRVFDQFDSTGVTVIVRPEGLDVMNSVSVAVSAPPVVGIAQVERSK